MCAAMDVSPKNLPLTLPDFLPGTVWIVGAGPGDAGLLTLLAWHGMQHADCVVYDALVGDDVLKLARPGAELIYAGKRGGKPSAQQGDISELLVQEAKKGRRVLRLKGGDPFVFGRGAEECLHLAEAGIQFRVVPGITAGVGALAYAGIPVTTRGKNTAVTFITGYTQGGSVPEDIDWTALSRGSPALVFYMGAPHLAHIAEKLMEAGRAPDEPVAILSRATLPDQKVLETTLGRCAEDLKRTRLAAPTLIVVGPVAALRRDMRWFEES
jgi:uroporphyrin-III C-methyltransferase